MIFIKRKNENLITTRDGLTRFSIEYLIMLVPLLAAGTYLNGTAALWRAGVSCLACMLTQAAGRKLFALKGSLKDLSAITTGLIISLLLPASCPLWLPALGSAFAVAVAEIPFGGTAATPFMSAAAGWCFLSVCFSDAVFSFPPVNTGTSPAVFGTENFVSAQSLSQMLKLGKTVSLNIFGADTLLTGRVPGAAGTTSVLVLIGTAIFLLIKRPKRLIPCAGFIGICAVMAFLFPRVPSGRLSSVVCELCAGNLLFTALLIVNHPVTCPKKKADSLLYGALAGVLCMVLSYYGKYSDNACFSVLIMNVVWPAVEDVKQYIIHAKTEKKNIDRIRAREENSLPVIEDEAYSVKKTHEPVLSVGKEAEPEEDDDPMLAPAGEAEAQRLKEIEKMFFNEVVRPVKERSKINSIKKTYSDIQSDIQSSQYNSGYTPDTSYDGFRAYAPEEDGEREYEDIDYRKYLTQTEDKEDE
ncbi:MAG: RnfABCDGE type electron transport complex subunit D [Clostridia bacterium]|nr:RnfABCDGE type electron transport complex subunit D [Clostridia bacterium]